MWRLSLLTRSVLDLRFKDGVTVPVINFPQVRMVWVETVWASFSTPPRRSPPLPGNPLMALRGVPSRSRQGNAVYKATWPSAGALYHSLVPFISVWIWRVLCRAALTSQRAPSSSRVQHLFHLLLPHRTCSQCCSRNTLLHSMTFVQIQTVLYHYIHVHD